MKNNSLGLKRDKPMNIYLVGLNHHTAPVHIREKVAINADRLKDGLELLRQYIPNGIVLSTCNRTEIYAAGSEPSEEAILNFIDAFTGVSFVDLLPHIYLRENETAFKHLFRIAEKCYTGGKMLYIQANSLVEAHATAYKR